MMLRYSFDYEKEANIIDNAIKNILNKGLRTADIAGAWGKSISTSEMGNELIGEIAELLRKS